MTRTHYIEKIISFHVSNCRIISCRPKLNVFSHGIIIMSILLSIYRKFGIPIKHLQFAIAKKDETEVKLKPNV